MSGPILPRFPSWEDLYREEPTAGLPWFYEALDPDVARALERHGITGGTVLDVGTGPGTQAVELAKRGFEVTGIDISETAIEKAIARAKDAGVSVVFLRDDVLESRLDARFDLVLDRGCFHVLDPERRADYLRSIRARVAPGGYLFLECFSHLQIGPGGPYRFTPEELRALFEEAFEVVSIEDTVIRGTLDPLPKALFAVMRAAAGSEK